MTVSRYTFLLIQIAIAPIASNIININSTTVQTAAKITIPAITGAASRLLYNHELPMKIFI